MELLSLMWSRDYPHAPLNAWKIFFLIYWIWFYSTLEVIVCSMTLVHIRNQFFPMPISNMTTMINLSWNWTKLDRICSKATVIPCRTCNHKYIYFTLMGYLGSLIHSNFGHKNIPYENDTPSHFKLMLGNFKNNFQIK